MIVQGNRDQQGFTLIELLIAMAVSAVVAVLAYQAVDQVVTVKESSESSIERFQKVQRAIWWMEQDFTQMAPRTISDELGGTLPAYLNRSGQDVELTRIAIFPSPYGVSGLVRVGYLLEGETLYRLVWPVLDRAPDTEPLRLPILDKVVSFGVNQLSADGQWLSVWPQQQEQTTLLPTLIEMRIEIEGLGEIRRLFPGVDGMPITTESDSADND